MTLIEERPETAQAGLEHVREMVTLLARYYRALGMQPGVAQQAALREFEADYPDEIEALQAEVTDDG
jgi:hypothetical protein